MCLRPPTGGRGGLGGWVGYLVLRQPPNDTYPPSRAQVSAGVSRHSMGSECALGCPWSTARATAPSPGRPTPGVVKQDKSFRGSVDTTKTRSGPQRVGRYDGERPINGVINGAAGLGPPSRGLLLVGALWYMLPVLHPATSPLRARESMRTCAPPPSALHRGQGLCFAMTNAAPRLAVNAMHLFV